MSVNIQQGEEKEGGREGGKEGRERRGIRRRAGGEKERRGGGRGRKRKRGRGGVVPLQPIAFSTYVLWASVVATKCPQ